MGLEEHPNVFRFEGKLWVSELPREEMLAEITTQRSWDAASERREHWGLAIGIGAVVGAGLTYLLTYLAGFPPVINLFLLPVGFAVGAVLAAMVNKRIQRPGPATSRPVISVMTKIPPGVARKAPVDASARQLIDWSLRGYVS